MTTNSAFDLISLDDLRNDPRYRNIDGQVEDGPQLAVAVLDTGLYGSHPLLDDNFLAYGDFVDNNTGRAVSADEVVFTNVAAASEDTNGHGTHVAGTIGAEDDSIAVAPEVKLIGLNVIGGPFTNNTTNGDVLGAVLNGLEWVKDNRQFSVEGEDYRIVSLNMSLGFYGKANSLENAPYALQGIFTSEAELNNRSASSPEVRSARLTQELESAGISVVSATGNDYSNHAQLRQLGQVMPDGSQIPVKNVSTPAVSSTIAAGSINAQQGEISSFSQRLDIPPMLHAPGGDILSTISPDGDQNGDGVEVLSGTSMASPHIAGAIALMQDAALTFGGRTLSTEEVQQILVDTADVINDGDDENYTSPTTPTGENFLRMNIYSAVQEIDRRFGGTEQPDPDPEPSPENDDPNGTISGAISLENDLDITVDSLAEFTVVGSEVIGADGEVQVGGNDVDLISFDVPESGGLISLETTTSGSDDFVDTVLRLFNSEGNELAVDDDGGEDAFSRIEIPLEQGTYYAGISSYDNFDYNPNVANSGMEGGTGTYALGIQFQGGGNIVGGDRNGTIETATVADFLVFDELETQVAGSIIGSDPIPDVSDRASVGRTDIDIARFEVTTAGFMIIESSNGDPDASESLDSVLRLFDSEGNELAIDDDGGEGSFSRIETNLEVGTYYLGISGYDNLRYDPNTLEGRSEGSIGSTDITFDFQPAGNSDPNGVRNGALEAELLPGEVTTITGEIGTDFDIEVTEDDVDLVTFTPTENATLLIDTDTPFGGEFDNGTDGLIYADTYLRLFDAEGSEIASSDDDFAEDISGTAVEFDTNTEDNSSFGDLAQDQFGNLIGHDVDSFIRADVTAGETYYLGVSAFGNDSYSIDDLDDRSTEDSGGLYQLLITNITTPDSDGSIGQAPILGAEGDIESIAGNIGFDNGVEIGDDDVDIYEYTPTQRGLLQLDIDAFSTLPEEDAVDSMLFLYDAQGKELAFNDDEAFGIFDARLEYLVDRESTYYIAVAGYGNGDFEPLVVGSGNSGDTGDYTLNIDLLQPESSEEVENSFAAAFSEFLAGDSFTSQLDFDRNVVGTAFSELDISEINTLSLGQTVTSFLGEDPQNSENIFSSFGDLYNNQASLVFGSSEATTNITTGGLPDDADYFLLPIEEAGRYDLRTLVGNTDVGSIGTQTNLRLYNSDLEEVEVDRSDIGLSGVNSRLTVNVSEPGNYWVVVLPDGSAAARFDFANHSFGELSDLERQEFSESLGEYGLSTDRFVLQAEDEPFFNDGILRLQLNDNIDTEAIDADSVTVVDSEDNPVDGSVVVENLGEIIFVPDSPLGGGEYTVTYKSDRFLTADTSFAAQRNLDGDRDGTPGGDLVTSFTVDQGGTYVFTPNFGRTPGESVNVEGTGLPVFVSNGSNLRDIRLRVDYDSDLLNISDATLAEDLPDDWSISQVDIANNRAIIDLAGTTPLSPGDTELIRLNATVPEDASSNTEQVLQVSGGAINQSHRSLIFSETAAVHDLSQNEEVEVPENPDDPDETIELFRFRNTSFSTGTYVFVGEAERDFILEDENLSQTFALDGVAEDGSINPAFTASTEDGDDLIPFYRLESLAVPGTFLFVSTAEYEFIFNDPVQSEQWKQQGFADESETEDIPEFYLLDNSIGSGTQFNRFQNLQNGTFLYAGSAETEAIESNPNLADLFDNQGNAFKSLA